MCSSDLHLAEGAASYDLSELVGDCGDLRRLLKIDGSSGGNVTETVTDSVIRFDGYGVAALTNAPQHLEGAEFLSP